MKIPQLKKKSEIKTCHNISWEDDYSWIHQDDILEVLKDSKKLNPEVRKYLEEENSYTDFHLLDTKNIQKKLFDPRQTQQTDPPSRSVLQQREHARCRTAGCAHARTRARTRARTHAPTHTRPLAQARTPTR